MDRFIVVSKQPRPEKSRASAHPYQRPVRKESTASNDSSITRRLVTTLKQGENPITHSNLMDRTDHVHSLAGGHQRGEPMNGSRIPWNTLRSSKLDEQASISSKLSPSAAVGDSRKPLTGVAIYINGLLKDTCDIELKRIVIQAGGRILRTPSNATHIVTSQELAGPKVQAAVNIKSKNRTQVVSPSWVTASIDAGHKVPERPFLMVLRSGDNKSISQMLTVKHSS
ncbi:hypothetical protein DL96DRAFT_1027097 [Flagelloscypha sp. PMI_526]|nr:hypothetical protein DL96DRAFT_1027097 [Flagelloscypha sp. PMI_526]